MDEGQVSAWHRRQRLAFVFAPRHGWLAEALRVVVVSSSAPTAGRARLPLGCQLSPVGLGKAIPPTIVIIGTEGEGDRFSVSLAFPLDGLPLFASVSAP